MEYKNIICGKFLSRPNRFIANVEINGEIQTVHVKNTGRCKELLIPNASVILSASDNPSRKTKYDLIAVYKKGLGLVNIDSLAPNAVVKEWLENNPGLFPDITLLKPEYTYGKSRIDFYFECGKRKILMEVKGCTLEYEGVGYFPDAPTERGVKHIEELRKAAKEGYESYLAFVIAMPKVRRVLPNVKTHPEFARALEKAEKDGVKVMFLPCEISENHIAIKKSGVIIEK